jgi:hypothetical protein
VAVRTWPELSSATTLLYLFCILILVIAMNIVTNRQLKTLNLPASYISMFQISRIIQYVGIGILFAIIALNTTRI